MILDVEFYKNYYKIIDFVRQHISELMNKERRWYL